MGRKCAVVYSSRRTARAKDQPGGQPHRFHYWRPYDRVEGAQRSGRPNREPEKSSVAKKRTGKKKKQTPAAGSRERPIADNRKARHRFDVIETLECGIALAGSEVKSLRNGKISLDEAYGRVRHGEFWLIGCDIPEYTQATIWNHAPKRPRKLLAHRRELRKFAGKAHEKGLTLVPLKVYFNERGIAKVLMGLCRGRKLHDKRQAMKNADVRRDLQRAMRKR